MEKERRSQTAYTGARNAGTDVYTSVYAPTHGSVAYDYAQTAEALPREQQERPARQPARKPAERPAPQAAPRQRRRAQLSPGARASLVFSVLVFAVAALMVIFRYHEISKEWAVVNALNKDIEAAELRIRELTVELECAVNIEKAQEAAERLQMTYPQADQYVRAGDALVLANAQQPEDDDQPTEPDDTGQQ